MKLTLPPRSASFPEKKDARNTERSKADRQTERQQAADRSKVFGKK